MRKSRFTEQTDIRVSHPDGTDLHPAEWERDRSRRAKGQLRADCGKGWNCESAFSRCAISAYYVHHMLSLGQNTLRTSRQIWERK
jgi:hypothetical protein